MSAESERKAEAKQRDATAKVENRDPAMVAKYRLLRASQEEEAALEALKSEFSIDDAEAHRIANEAAREPSQRLPG